MAAKYIVALLGKMSPPGFRYLLRNGKGMESVKEGILHVECKDRQYALVPGVEHSIEHGLVEQEVSHPFRDDDVDLQKEVLNIRLFRHAV